MPRPLTNLPPPFRLPQVFRCKGVFDIVDSDRMHVLQAVRATYDLAPGAAWDADNEPGRSNRAVFIGRNLDEAVLRAALLDCVAPAGGEAGEVRPPP